jgi:hypothetical protein
MARGSVLLPFRDSGDNQLYANTHRDLGLRPVRPALILSSRSLSFVAEASLRTVAVSKESSIQVADTSSPFLSSLSRLTRFSFIFLPGFLASPTSGVRPRLNQTRELQYVGC